MKTKLPNHARLAMQDFTFFCIMVILILLMLSACKKQDKPHKQITIDLQPIADGLVSPLQVVNAPGTKKLFILDQVGKIWLIDSNGAKWPTPFLDLSSRLVSLNGNYDERGLLGLAFHPDF